MDPVMMQAFRLAALDAMADTGGVLDALTLRLASNNIAVTKTLALADLVECTFTGYAAVAGITWGSSFIDPVDGKEKLVAPSELFERTGGAIDETGFIAYLTNVGETTLVWAWELPVPIPFTGPSIGTSIEPFYPWGA